MPYKVALERDSEREKELAGIATFQQELLAVSYVPIDRRSILLAKPTMLRQLGR